MKPISDHDYNTEQDFSLVNKLMRTPRYKIPEHLRDKIIGSIEKALDDPESTHTCRMAAARIALEADKVNLQLLQLALPKKVHHFDIKTATTDELMEAIKETHKLLPPVIDTEQTDSNIYEQKI